MPQPPPTVDPLARLAVRGDFLDTARAVPVVDERGRYVPALRALANASGTYAIVAADGQCLYVGESHTGRLYRTVQRHFQRWTDNPYISPRAGSRPRPVYDRWAVRWCAVVSEPGEAMPHQWAEIQRLQPRDNVVEGAAVIDYEAAAAAAADVDPLAPPAAGPDADIPF